MGGREREREKRERRLACYAFVSSLQCASSLASSNRKHSLSLNRMCKDIGPLAGAHTITPPFLVISISCESHHNHQRARRSSPTCTDHEEYHSVVSRGQIARWARSTEDFFRGVISLKLFLTFSLLGSSIARLSFWSYELSKGVMHVTWVCMLLSLDVFTFGIVCITSLPFLRVRRYGIRYPCPSVPAACS
jgi:hypothetical protein